MNESLLQKRLERERAARKQAEAILESKALELFNANTQLRELNENLEEEIKLRSKELSDSELRYRRLVEKASDIFFNIDGSGRFTYMNATGIHRFGYDIEEIIGHYFSEFVPDTHKKDLIVHYADFMSSNRESDYKEFPIKSKRGEVFWMGQNVNRLLDDASNPYFSAVARDISKRIRVEKDLKKAQSALTKSEVKYRSVIENMRLGLLEVDTKGTILKSYDRFNQMLGYQLGELEGKYANEVLADQAYEGVIEEQDKNRLGGASGVYEMKLKKKDGEDIWMLISGTPFYNEHGEVAGSIGIHYDITAEKILKNELELARQTAVKAQKAEKQFLANMSHEIRTPLNAIIGMSHLINDTPLSEEQGEYVDILISSTGILKNLIADILDMSKIDAGTLVLQEKEFSIEEDVNALVRSYIHKSKDKAVTYTYEVDPKIKTQIIADQQLLNQILLNLYSNGDKFTESGSVSLVVNVVNETATNLSLLFSVRDTGIGIDQDEVKTVFDEFKQANKEIRSKYGGTGLGLSISKKLLNLMGSDIKLESTPGEGSDFYFELSVTKGRPLDGAKTKGNKIDFARYQGESRMILVVEDNKLNVKYLTRLLEKWSIDFVVKSNGQEAVDFCVNNFPDLILMDLQMPVMDGFEATQIIRKLDNDNAHVPIIALTASTFLSKKQMAEQVGMTDFLSKPFTPDQLSAKLKTYLEGSSSEVTQQNESQFSKQLDTDYLLSAYGDDAVYALEIFETFVETIEGEMSALKVALTESGESLKNHLHKIKPIFTMVGLSHITGLVNQAEESCSNNDKESVSNQCNQVIKETTTYLPIILEEIKRLKTIV